MLNEYDVVQLIRDLPSKGLKAGTSGTILIVYDASRLPHAFEVEFADDKGVTLGVATVEETDVELIWKAPGPERK